MAFRTRLAAFALSTAVITQVIPAHATVLGPVELHFVDAHGADVALGWVTWTTTSASASHWLPVTAHGYVSVPNAPYEQAVVKLYNGEILNGMRVSGSWSIAFSNEVQQVNLPESPTLVTYPVHAAMPDGTPVPLASVSGVTALYPGTGAGLSGGTICPTSGAPCSGAWNMQCSTSGPLIYDCGAGTPPARVGDVAFVSPQNSWTNDFPFQYPEGAIADDDGNLFMRGFLINPTLQDPIQLKIAYDDGNILRTVTIAAAREEVSEAVLPYMPVAVTSKQLISAKRNATATVAVSIFSRTAETPNSSTPVTGIPVQVSGPYGVVQTCKGRKLSATSGLDGRAVVRLCAVRSGTYHVVANGAVGSGAVRVHVTRAAPLPPRLVTAYSSSPGSLTLAWRAPEYAGGSPIKSYKFKIYHGSPYERVVVVKRGSAAFTSKSITIHGLTPNYRATITAFTKTKYGTSDGTSTTAIVQ